MTQWNENSSSSWNAELPRAPGRRAARGLGPLLLAAALGLLGATTTRDAHAEDFWTGFGSEENPPRTCPAGFLVGGVRCTGRYCDNVSLLCRRANRSITTGWWTRYFSEEGNHTETCGSGFMTGIACNGSYCDNISLNCSTVNGATPRDCFWLNSRLSEEGGGTLALPSDLFIAGVSCYGSYCDNKDFLVCRL